MPDGSYEQDTLAWADRQATLLRCLASGERVNDAVDWPHVIDEVQDVGLSELRACQAFMPRRDGGRALRQTVPASRAPSPANARSPWASCWPVTWPSSRPGWMAKDDGVAANGLKGR